MANSKVPKFGGWNSGDNVGYTAFFETARKGKAGGTSPITNPNEMFLNSDMESAAAAAPPRSPPPANRPTTTTTSSKPAPPPKQQQQPKFGVWNEDAEEDIPYTAYFENTTKTKTNPNEPLPPRMNRDMPAAAAGTSKPSTKQQQPKFGEWNEGKESGPYSAYFENPRDKTEPKMNRDMGAAKPAAPPPTSSRPDPNQPKFGEWNEGEESGLYTAYFENPRDRGASTEPKMNRNMAAKPHPPPPTSTRPDPNQPKFGEWEEEAPYTAYFENNTSTDKIHAPKSSAEPQMNRDMATPTPTPAIALTPSRPDPRANEQQPMGYGGGQRRGGGHQQVQFANGGRSSAEPSPLHHRAGGGRSNVGSSNAPPKKSPPHYAAPGPSVPPFGNWGKEENYTEVFGQISKDGTTPGGGYNNASPYHHRSNPHYNQTKKQPKCGFLSWLCP